MFHDFGIDVIKEIDLEVDYSLSFSEAKSALCWLAVGIKEDHYSDSKIFNGKKKEGIERIKVKIIRFNKIFRLSEIKEAIIDLGLIPLSLVEMCALGKDLSGVLQTVISTGFTYESQNKTRHLPALKARDMSKNAFKGYWDSCPFDPRLYYFAIKEL